MNATKFVVLLFVVGLVCANVGARQLGEVVTQSYASAQGYSNANAIANPGGPAAGANGAGTGSTGGYVIAQGPYTGAYTSSNANGAGRANATAGADGATAAGSGEGGASTYGGGYAGK